MRQRHTLFITNGKNIIKHYGDVIMDTMASQITKPNDCLFSRLSRRRSKKTSKLRVTGLCAENSRWIPRTKGQ